MGESNQFDWVDFYKELSIKLLQYKDNREELIENIPQQIRVRKTREGSSLEIDTGV